MSLPRSPNHRGWVVLDRIGSPDGLWCVDLFERERGRYGFELLRADPEDGGRWTAVGGYGSIEHESLTAAFLAAAAQVPWLQAGAERWRTVEAALGPTWTRLNEEVDVWMAEHGDSLREGWRESLDDATNLSFELGVYLHTFATQELSYDTTPTPGWVFARTGGDGEHFSVLTGEGASGVIVLTAPMAFDSPNLVAGASLREFLTFSCTLGPSRLADLCYRGGVADIDELPTGETTALHEHLIDALGLEVIGDPLHRLRDLQRLYPMNRDSDPEHARPDRGGPDDAGDTVR